MRIGMVLDGFYPSDIRVKKEAESLAEKFDVFILCAKKEGELDFEVINGVTVCRKITYSKILSRGIYDILLSLTSVHYKFRKHLKAFVKEYKIEAIHVHDLPLAKTCLGICRKFHIKSIIDLHENYPAALLIWFSWRKNPLIRLKNRIFFNYESWTRYEKTVLKKFDYVIAVVEEMKERIIEQHQIDASKIVVVTNTEKRDFGRPEKFDPFFPEDSGKFIVSYVGGFGPHRGLQTAIEGMSIVCKEDPDVLLKLIGSGHQDVKSYLSEMINKFQLQKNVSIENPVPFTDVPKIMKSSDVNIIPHLSNEHTDNTIPHKLYQILLSKRPILVSDSKPLKRVIDDNQIGYVFKANSPESFAEEVLKIKKNYKEAMEKAGVGYQKSFEGNLNWEHTSQELLKLYDDLKV